MYLIFEMMVQNLTRLTFFILLLFPLLVIGQKPVPFERPPKPILKLNILGPLYGSISFQCELFRDKHSSDQYGLFIFTGQVLGQSIPAGGFGLTYDYRFYMKSENQTGFYVQPFGRYQHFQVDLNSSFTTRTSIVNNRINMDVFGLGLVLGKQWIIYNRLVFDMYLGPMYNQNSNNIGINHRDFRPFFDGFWYRCGLTIGIKL